MQKSSLLAVTCIQCHSFLHNCCQERLILVICVQLLVLGNHCKEWSDIDCMLKLARCSFTCIQYSSIIHSGCREQSIVHRLTKLYAKVWLIVRWNNLTRCWQGTLQPAYTRYSASGSACTRITFVGKLSRPANLTNATGLKIVWDFTLAWSQSNILCARAHRISCMHAMSI